MYIEKNYLSLQLYQKLLVILKNKKIKRYE